MRLEAETTSHKGFTLTIVKDSLLVYLLDIVDDMARIKGSVCVKDDHTVVLIIDESKVPVSEFRDIVNGKLKTMSQLINLMARLKNLTEEPHERSLNLQLDIFLQCLKMALRSIDDDQDEFRMIEFIIEQFKLSLSPN